MTMTPNHGLAFKVVHDMNTTTQDDVDPTREYAQIVDKSTGSTASITAADPNYGAVLNALIGTTDHAYTADEVLALINPALRLRAIATELSRLSQRITYHDDQWFYDERPMANALTKHIEKMYADSDFHWERYVLFLDNLALNPSEKSKRHLFHWMDNHDVVITEDGHLLMWKGVRSDGRSSHSGFALVDGVEIIGRIPNVPGTTISMPRDRVDPERDEACSYGLHVGTKSYAENFVGSSGKVVMCKVDPRDIVSVPSDCENQKVRTCRYEVTEVSPNTRFGPTFSEADSDDPEGSWLSTSWNTYDPARRYDDEEDDEDAYCLGCGDETDGEEFCFECDDENSLDESDEDYEDDMPPF